MLDQAVAVMPDRDTMMSALCGIFDDPHVKQDLYPRICQNLAGSEKVGTGVVMGLQLAIHDYTQGMPRVVAAAINGFMPNFIEAIAPEAIRDDALQMWNEVTTRQA